MGAKFVCLVLLKCILAVNSYKILGLFPHPGKSHVDTFLPIMKGLAKKGHEVTVISYFPSKETIPGYRDIILEGHLADGLVNILGMDRFTGKRIERYLVMNLLDYFARITCAAGLESKSLQEFIKNDNETFDVVISEFFNTDCFLGFAHKYKAPLIGLSSCSIMPWTSDRFANPTNPAYIPVNLLDHSDHLTFFERVENTLALVLNNLYYETVINKHDEQLIKKYFGDDTPPLKSIIQNASLFLVNTHFSLNLPRPYVPAVIEIGGIHVGKPKKLPDNLERWINESTHGVIYFSLGSMIKGHTFPEEKRQAFLRAFGRLPQRVLWKWENDTMPGKPENVMIQKWMPQLDILCHPNVKAFISHGGLLGTTEAVHCGVPAVVMPQYGDQHTNARALEASGGGVILKLHEADEEKVYNALRTVLDPDFRKGAQELSARFRDRPLPPLETAIYWVEYVARHRGAHHMRTAAVGMPSYKYFLLDVIAFLLLVSVAISAVFFYIAKAIFRRLFAGRSKVKTN